jgi:organic hydroperoxide reductase OsmC/OhrA
MEKTHNYEVLTRWTGDLGTGTSGYKAYSRNHEIEAAGKQQTIACSSDPAFRGERSRYNPEELLVASLSGCHMLWYLHLCADAGVVVVEYADTAQGRMVQGLDGGGHFSEVVLRPRVAITRAVQEAQALHHQAHRLCFVANSVNFPVTVQAHVRVGTPPTEGKGG